MDSIDQFLDDSASGHEEDETVFHPPIIVDRGDIQGKHTESIAQNAMDDYEFARTNMKQIIETNVKALEKLSKIAVESDSPRVYEVMSTYIKQMTDANKALIDLHSSVQIIVNDAGAGSGGSGDGDNSTTVTNNFIGSAEEFLDMLEKQAKTQEKTIEGVVTKDD